MTDDFEDMKRNLTVSSLADELSVARNWADLTTEQMRRQIELASRVNISTRHASIDPYNVHSAASLAVQDQLRLASHDGLVSRFAVSSAYEDSLVVAERFRANENSIEKLIGATNYSATANTVAGYQATLDQQKLIRDTIGSVSEIHARLDRQDIIRSAMMGPLADLRAVGVLDGVSSAATLHVRTILEDYESRYRLPTGIELASLESITSVATSIASRFRPQIATSLAELHHPFVNIADPYASVATFAELQGITRAVSSLTPFEDSLTRSLRTDLGDWQQFINPPASMFGNVEARTDFYTERGLRVGLTDFPAEAFEANIEIVESDAGFVSLAEIFGEPIEPGSDEDAAAFIRTNEIQGWILRLEAQMRAVIQTVMVAAYGSDWVRLKMSPETLEDWRKKQALAAKAGKPTEPLVLFSDLTDFERIICNRGHWPHFKSVFKVGEFLPVRESLQRLYLPRVESSHGRFLTQDDYLYAFVELKRLGKALKSWREETGH